ncbi:MAG: B12-binding domain-containing radical SAM protein [Proteobacteria bacterium]|nr:B12-binding domain-containing radical SAM protein [Desulfobacula sp.]MBU3952096.1 B12-binding domain-containing radical SAM protein [Pseudomonadota bacterium]
MTIALIYPPTCDPTAPYLSLPTLAAWLRAHGKKVLPVDANIEAYDRLLQGKAMARMVQKICSAHKRLDQKSSLDHRDQMHYSRLWEVAGDLSWVTDSIDDAVSVLRDRTGQRFFHPPAYERAVQTVQAGLAIISAAYSPLLVDFTGYRTPFSLLTPEQIRSDADPEKNPFHDGFQAVADRMKANKVNLIGISLAFPGQIQPGFSLAYHLRQQLPGVHITVGGPAITQILVRQTPENQTRILGPFDSAVLYEGEDALLDLVNMLEQGEVPERIIFGRTDTPLAHLPPPDFEGLPLEAYFSPELVLPYDPTRGCYWGRCAFCHYGLCRKGTAKYRQRKVGDMVAHLKEMAARWGCRNFYFSQDAFLPKTARKLSLALQASDLKIHWSTDMRPEPELTEEVCKDLAAGGALSMALGIESASPRLLKLINKGIFVDRMQAAVENLGAAGIAVEAMCFNGFPTETPADAMATLGFIRTLKEKIALFICGRFGLWHGSHVALHPELYGIRRIWQMKGDELGTGLFYESRVPRSPGDQDRIDGAIDRLSDLWWLHDYPWAGALSTAHTLLWYARKGADVFRRHAAVPDQVALPQEKSNLKSRFNMKQMMARAGENEARIWQTLVHGQETVGREPYEALAASLPRAYPMDAGRPARLKKVKRK